MCACLHWGAHPRIVPRGPCPLDPGLPMIRTDTIYGYERQHFTPRLPWKETLHAKNIIFRVWSLLNTRCGLQPLSAATKLPLLAFNDMYIYLVHNPSPYTGESLKAYKSTDAYRYFVAGWVLDPKIWHLHKKKMFLVKGRVSVLLTQLCKQLLAASLTTQG